MQIIGLAGHMGSGKDLVGKMLSNHGYRRIAFGDALRQEVEAAIASGTLPPELPYGIRVLLGGITTEEVWGKPTSDRCRKLLQWWGTEYRRAQDPDYWINKVRDTMRSIGGKWAVTDVRFPNEANMIAGEGGETWLIRRSVQRNGIPAHISERIDLLSCERVLDNESTIDALRATVDIAMAA